MQRAGETIRQCLPTTLSAHSKMPLEGISNWFFFHIVQIQSDLQSVRKIYFFIAADSREIWYTVP